MDIASDKSPIAGILLWKNMGRKKHPIMMIALEIGVLISIMAV